MKRKRLTDSEIRSAVDKIRKRYGDYMVQFLKGRTALDSFEDRYIQAMRARLDLALFLHAEMTVVEELIKTHFAAHRFALDQRACRPILHVDLTSCHCH